MQDTKYNYNIYCAFKVMKHMAVLVNSNTRGCTQIARSEYIQQKQTTIDSFHRNSTILIRYSNVIHNDAEFNHI